ncbi:hypothetical protein [Trichloromonas sp.]|uniref:hypothetical protein n=1 Tax=Trichloromonas sp. TaxID=3069249 RepID=UPI002A4A0254|nr:DUF3261 domain-containing protein [Trichloromonas sp.]
MSLRQGMVGLCLVLLLGGCASVPFEKPRLVPTRILTAAELLAADWRAAPGLWRIRQSGLFELRGRRLPMEGFLELDNDGRRVRLVALEGLGLKLFDLTVNVDGVEVHHLLPDLAKEPRLAESVAASVRRIFLAPRPDAGDRLEIRKRDYRLTRPGDDGIEFLFGGEPPLLLETRVRGEAGDWRVGYYEYREAAGVSIPAGILLQDRRAGYRLTLWLESVKHVEK